MSEIKAGKYKHFKWKIYEVIWVGRHTETLEEFVVYRACYDSKQFWNNALWIRPKNMFLEKVAVNGKKISRFKYIWE